MAKYSIGKLKILKLFEFFYNKEIFKYFKEIKLMQLLLF
jgi:hypothetical protein